VHARVCVSSVCVCLHDPVSVHAMFKEPLGQLGCIAMALFDALFDAVDAGTGGSAKEALAEQDPDFEGQARP